MSVEVLPSSEVNAEVFAGEKFNQLRRLVMLDVIFSDMLSSHNQLIYHQDKPVDAQYAKIMQDTRNAIRIGIFNTWMDVSDTDTTMGLRGLALMDLGRQYQNGRVNAVPIGENTETQKELTVFMRGQLIEDMKHQFRR